MSAPVTREQCQHRKVVITKHNDTNGVEKGRCQDCGTVVYRYASPDTPSVEKTEQ